MAILIFVIGLVLFIFFACENYDRPDRFDDYFDNCWLALFIGAVGVVMFGYNAYQIRQCQHVIPAQIAMYEEENARIEEKVANTVTKYMEYEKDIFIEVGPDDDAFTLISLYPELRSDTLISKEIEVYIKNNDIIKELKSEMLRISNYRFWLYFGH